MARRFPGLGARAAGAELRVLRRGVTAELIYEWLKAKEGLSLEQVPFCGIAGAVRELVAARMQAGYSALLRRASCFSIQHRIQSLPQS